MQASSRRVYEGLPVHCRGRERTGSGALTEPPDTGQPDMLPLIPLSRGSRCYGARATLGIKRGGTHGLLLLLPLLASVRTGYRSAAYANQRSGYRPLPTGLGYRSRNSRARRSYSCSIQLTSLRSALANWKSSTRSSCAQPIWRAGVQPLRRLFVDAHRPHHEVPHIQIPLLSDFHPPGTTHHEKGRTACSLLTANVMPASDTPLVNEKWAEPRSSGPMPRRRN